MKNTDFVKFKDVFDNIVILNVGHIESLIRDVDASDSTKFRLNTTGGMMILLPEDSYIHLAAMLLRNSKGLLE